MLLESLYVMVVEVQTCKWVLVCTCIRHWGIEDCKTELWIFHDAGHTAERLCTRHVVNHIDGETQEFLWHATEKEAFEGSFLAMFCPTLRIAYSSYGKSVVTSKTQWFETLASSYAFQT